MKIRHQQFLVLLLSSVLLFFILSFFIYKSQKEVLQVQTNDHLISIAEAKKKRLAGIIRSNFEIVSLPANNNNILSNLNDFIVQGDSSHLIEINTTLKKYVYLIRSFEKIHIVTLNGKVIASSDSLFINYDFSKQEVFLKPVSGNKYFDGFHYNGYSQLNLYLSTPLFYTNKIVGVLIIEKAANEIVSITGDYAGLGRSGETVLAKESRDSIVYLTPLRKDRVRKMISMRDTAIPMTKALKNQERLITNGIDYLNTPVIAITRYIPGIRWGMVVKIDKEEAMAPVYHLRKILILFDVAAILLAVFASYIGGNYLSKPVKEIIVSTNKFTDGDLSVRIRNAPPNELGVLAESFNHMADNLEKKIEQMDKYAYIISHDLKSPLASIEGLVTIIKQHEENHKHMEEEDKKLLGMINSKVLEMKLMIDNVLRSAKLEKKIKEPVNLFDLTQEVINTLNPPPQIKIFIQQSLPKVKYHKTSLIRIMQNLLENAIKYANKENAEIIVNYSEVKNYFKIGITDNGIGIPKEKLNLIFKPFEISHKNEKIESHGLGLSIVKQLVEEHGGEIWVESELEKGTTFYFTIPKD
jgi:signal transduction histidine kinase